MKKFEIINILLIFFLISQISFCYEKKRHLCIHDQVANETEVAISPDPDEGSGKRLLQNTESNMRVTFDFTKLEVNYLNDSNIPPPTNYTKQQLIDYIKKQLTAAQQFIGRLIKLIPSSVITFPNSSSTCGANVYPQQKDYQGLNDSDLHIYLNYTYVNSTTLAYASLCALQLPYYRATFGYITYNLYYYNSADLNSAKEFEDQLEVTVHELTHVLGFSASSIKSYWYDPETQQPYGNGTLSKILLQNQTFRNISTTNLLTSPHVREFARNYYNCSTLLGMQLENQGESGSLGSHWERTVLSNEYMTASAISTDAAFSRFTFNLLLDSGWYSSIDFSLADEIQWGKDKGCGFFNLACKDPNQQYQEFSYSANDSKCNYDYNGYGAYSLTDTFGDTCPIIKQYSNTDCSNPKNILDPYWRILNNELNPFLNFGWNSRCFQSSLFHSGYTINDTNYQCYQFLCSADGTSLSLILGQTSYQCENNSQTISVQGYTGKIYCPSNIQKFCNIPNYCKNFCSSNGICLNEQCHCLPGFSGEDCSVNCNAPTQLLHNNICVQECPTTYFMNPYNRVCQSCEQLIGYFINPQTTNCEQCYYRCKTCSNYSDICQTCDETRYLSDQTCLCKDGFLDNYMSSQCDRCQVGNCKFCYHSNNCSECLPGYVIDTTTYTSCLICLSPCLQCSYIPSNCTSCIVGYVKFENLSTLSSSCVQTCPIGYYQSLGTLNCEKCYDLCKTCLNANDICSSCYAEKNRILQNSYCACQTGYFEDYSVQPSVCQLCPSGCATCTNTSSCQSCVSGYFFNPVILNCQLCYITCKTCSSSSDICTSCELTTRTLVNNSCHCLDGYFESFNYTCTSCPVGCLTCSNAQQCGNCKPGYNLTNNICVQVLVCNTNQYVLNNACTNCSSTCKTCESTSSNCLSCPNTTNWYNFTCVQTCINGYYSFTQSDNTKKCLQCYGRCQTCINSSDICTSCVISQNRNLTNVSCVCSPGYFQDGSNLICGKCIDNCKTCQASQECLECVAGYFYNYSTLNCVPCYATCKTCSPNGAEVCTSCEITTRILNGNTCQCLSGYYETYQNLCMKCNVECGNCTQTASNCLSCAVGYSFIQNICTKLITCATNQYSLNNTSCVNCSVNCSTCIQASTYCTSCASPKKLYNGTCLTACVNGTVATTINNTNICTPCYYKCKTCINTTDVCTSCDSNLFRNLLLNKCECISGYYELNSTCQKCFYRCLTCSGANDICTSCEQTRIQYNVSCQCRDGFFENYTLQSPSCTGCPLGCKTCSSLSNCSVCFEGYFFDNATLSCPACVQGCSVCNDTSKCIQCKSAYQLNSTTSQCTPKCAVNQYVNEIQQICANCTSPCATCYSSGNLCLSCVSGYNLNIDNCVTTCPVGYYSNLQVCRTCVSLCKTCFGAEKNCTTCIQGFFLQLGSQNINNECLQICRGGYYGNTATQTCDICHSSCLNCSITATNCTACLNTTLFLNNGSCIVNCLDNQYSYLRTCFNCEQQCKTCAQDSNLCTSCPNTSYLYERNCLTQCKDGQYGDNSTRTCIFCNSICKSCISKEATGCISCYEGFYLVNSTCKSLCNITQYLDPTNNNCTQCNDNCLSCFGPGTNQCKSCKNNLTLMDGICIDICPQYYYKNIEFDYSINLNISVCRRCAPSCLTCSGPTFRDCLSCDVNNKHFTYDSVNKTCFCNIYENRVYDDLIIGCKCTNITYPITVPDNTSAIQSATKEICSLNCLPGYYGDQNQQCPTCDLNVCTTCSKEKSNCTSCSNVSNNKNLLFINITNNLAFGYCVSTCPNNFVSQNNNTLCSQCHFSCAGCINSPVKCVNCAQGFATINNSDLCYNISGNYPAGFYYDNYTTSFKPCNSICTTCYGADYNQCYSCIYGYVLQNNSTCVKQCPQGCSDCLKNYDFYCLGCNGDLQLQITNWQGYYIDNVIKYAGYCVQNCSVLNASGATNTTTVKLFYLNSVNTCITQCPPTLKFNENLFCRETCSPNKPYYFPTNLTCVLKCPNSFVNVSKQCIDYCPLDTYFNQIDKGCYQCHNSCQSCFAESINSCTSCRQEQFLVNNTCYNTCDGGKIFNGSCFDSCPLFTYQDLVNTSLCQPCHSSCITCLGNGSNQCFKCASQSLYFALRNVNNNTGECLTQCPADLRYSQNIFCKSNCDDGYFANLTNFQCQQCQISCKTCSIRYDNCTTCLDSQLYNLVNGTCVFKMTCPTSCLTCNNLGVCLSCQQNYFFLNTNKTCNQICPQGYVGYQGLCNVRDTFVLPEGFFVNSTTNIATPCRYGCKLCTSLTVCSECIVGFTFFNTTCLDNSKCHSSCLQCNGPIDNNCTACASITVNSTSISNSTTIQLFLFKESPTTARCIEASKCPVFAFQDFNNNFCVDICPLGLYGDLLTKICKKCHYTCKNCTGSTEKQCNDCFDGMSLILNENYCAKSTSCYPTCLYCSGPQKNQCISCANSSSYFYQGECLPSCPLSAPYILSGKCLNSCPDAFYANPSNNFCTICPRGCLTCSNATQCLSCKQFYSFNQTTMTCTAICLEGTFLTQDSAGMDYCQQCNQTCSECSNSTACTKCAIGYFLQSNGYTCDKTCTVGNYGDQASRQCKSCDQSCLTCKGDSQFACLSCVDGMYLIFSSSGSQCIENCLDGFFPIDNYTNPYTQENNTLFCQKCHYECATCLGPNRNNCQSCNKETFFDSSSETCVKSIYCPVGTFPNFTSWECQSCNPSCKTCVQIPNFCTSCTNSSQYLLYGQCFDNCDQNPYFYADAATKMCLPCHATCQTCNGSLATNCLTCRLPLVKSGTVCASNCSQAGQFLDTTLQMCLNCSANCLTCYSVYDTSCTSCKTGFFLNSQQQCVDICDLGFYANNNTKTCTKCNQACYTCISATSCDSCAEGYLQQIDKCVISCELGFFLDRNVYKCLACSQACKECYGTSSQECYSCNTGYYLFGSTCMANCTAGYFGDNSTKRCLPCAQSCLTCSSFGNTSCTSCPTGYIQVDGKCLPGCPTYLQPNYPNCQICITYVNNTQITGCKNCTDTKIYEVNSTGQCSIRFCELMQSSIQCKSCKVGYGLSYDNRYCIDNSQFTIKCARYDIDGVTCKECISGWGLKTDTKKCDINLTALQIPGCIKYLNTTPSTCGECGTFWGLLNGTCKENQITGYVLNCKVYSNNKINNTQTCTKCQQDYGLNIPDNKCFQINYLFFNSSVAVWNSPGKYSALDATCQQNFQLTSAGCIYNYFIQNCSTYYFDTTSQLVLCKLCISGLVPSSFRNSCIVEIQGCKIYDALGACTTCNNPLTLSGGSCITQYTQGQYIGCREIKNGICVSCWVENGFNQLADNTTGQCKCSAANNSLNEPINNAQWYCTYIKPGCTIYNAANSSCVCKAYRDATKCKECWNSTFMLSPDSTQCLGFYNSQQINCTYQWKSGSCFQCKTGFILISTTCKPIPTTRANQLALCAQANTLYTCTRCKVGYLLNSSSSTTPCYAPQGSSARLLQESSYQNQELFSYCAIYDPNRPGYCQYCQEPQISIDGVCYNRQPYCDVQTSPDNCDRCYTGFYLSTDGQCHENTGIMNIIDNCDVYNSDFSCLKCSQDFLLSSQSQFCIPNCQKQSTIDSRKCELCYENYVSINGYCLTYQDSAISYPNSENCATYNTNIMKCTQCHQGWGLFQNSCISNFLNVAYCQLYSSTSQQQCKICEEGFVPVKQNSICYYLGGQNQVEGCGQLAEDFDGINQHCDPNGCLESYAFNSLTQQCYKILGQGLDKNNDKKARTKDRQKEFSSTYLALIIALSVFSVIMIGLIVVILKKKQQSITQAKIQPVQIQNQSQIGNTNDNTLGIENH